MPIASDEFDKGRKISTTERTVLEFLKSHKTQAYTQSEILSSLYSASTSDWKEIARGVLAALGVERALDTLVKEGSVKAKQVGNATYYKA